jgi:hypothetical protein
MWNGRTSSLSFSKDVTIMHFRLWIDGPIQPRRQANLADIHRVRRQVHHQMRRLWEQFPLCKHKGWIREHPEREGEIAILERRGTRSYVPLVTDKAALYCALDVLFLRTEPPGNLIRHGGDIDNRIKTLFDALRVPPLDQVNALGSDLESDDDPLFCLLQDDSLIAEANVTTDRLLTSDTPNDIRAIVNVRLFGSSLTWGNMDLLAL